MDLIEASKEMTKFLSDDQYLVTLNIRRSRSALKTENPNDPPLIDEYNTSNTLPVMTYIFGSERMKLIRACFNLSVLRLSPSLHSH